MNDGQKLSEVGSHGDIHLTGQQLRFPDAMIRLNGFHCEQIIVAVIKQDSRYGPDRENRLQHPHRVDFPPDSLKLAEPFNRSPELFARLLHNKASLRRVNAEHDIGHPPRQFHRCRYREFVIVKRWPARNLRAPVAEKLQDVALVHFNHSHAPCPIVN